MSTDTGAVTVRLLLFAQFREALGERERDLSLEAGATPRDALARVCETRPQLGAIRDVVRFIVNGEFVGGDEPLREGDELAFVPPVAGG
jgi:molybdopterin converting factor subunit 1